MTAHQWDLSFLSAVFNLLHIFAGSSLWQTVSIVAAIPAFLLIILIPIVIATRIDEKYDELSEICEVLN